MPVTNLSSHTAEQIAMSLYGLQATASRLPGEIEFNFLLSSGNDRYLLKVSPPDSPLDSLEFQNDLLGHLTKLEVGKQAIIPDINSKQLSEFEFQNQGKFPVRLLTWADGILWSQFNPKTAHHLLQLGQTAGELTQALQNFTHPYAMRNLEWDVSQAAWVAPHLQIFEEPRRNLVAAFYEKFKTLPKTSLRRSVVHNDVNDNNIVMLGGNVSAIIDFGDAIETETINDVAIALAYAMMHQPDILGAARAFLQGYHEAFPLTEEELAQLYVRIGMRLVISVTKSALNQIESPENEYLQISEAPAWELLERLSGVSEDLALCHFRKACGYDAVASHDEITQALNSQQTSVSTLLPTLDATNTHHIDMSVGSGFFDSPGIHQDIPEFERKLNTFANSRKADLLINGYSEVRPFYSTSAYRREGNNGPEYRTVHLGTDFWAEAQTPVHAPIDGEVYSVHNNIGDKDYGPTVLLKHETVNYTFYTLYGHLSQATLDLLDVGQQIIKGELLGWLGHPKENGNWVPHLHFQIILDLFDNEHDFPGVAYPNEVAIWNDICPDPSNLFSDIPEPPYSGDLDSLIEQRKAVLGRGMSISYNTPLIMLRGEGAFLIDHTGRKYLDTVNNVAHVGHEHPRVVRKGKEQMGILNTNTRYLHPGILAFGEKLAATLPPELSVVHVVNSGSEANELALRMAYTVTGQKDILALEVGYHGNTTGTVNISSYKFDGKGGAGAPPFTHVLPIPDSFRGKYRGANTGSLYANHAKDSIESILNQGRKPAGFICESILSCGGQIVLPEGYLKEVYALVRAAGGLCIADEVQVGCGRTGSHYWAFEAQGVVPDIVTIGKPIGNGHPLAAVVCTPAIADAFANGMEYFNTFGGNPVSSAIGLEVLRVIEEEGLQENASAVGEYLKSGLLELQEKYDCIGDVRGRGFFLGIELCTPNKDPLPEHASYLVNRARELGILMSTDGPDYNVIKIKPPMVFSHENAEELLLRLDQIFSENFMK